MSVAPAAVPVTGQPPARNKLLFWACFIALVATAFGFIVRAFLMDTWAAEFGFTETQKGEIFGVGLWPFAVSIILFSLVIDKIGYGKVMVFAFICHIISAIVTVWAPYQFDPYWSLYVGNLIVGLGNGAVEAVINPVVATLFTREKTKWLNILHAGWPGGLVVGGILAILLANFGVDDWRVTVGLILIPTVLYGVMLLACRFPVSERVAAGVSYREMLREFGVIGCLLVSFLIFAEVGRVFGWNAYVIGAIIVIVTLAFGGFIGFAPGRPMFIFLLFIMIPLATTELGTDSWITPLMEPQMTALGLAAGWVLIYTSFIMMVLRFFAGPIVHKLSPLGLLCVSALVAGMGLVFLSAATGVMILAAATLYGFGKTFFWPTMLGVVAEQFPKGGALTLNATGGVGMLGVGVVGAVFLGYIQDTSIENKLAAQAPTVHAQVVDEKPWVFGRYEAVDPDKVTALAPLAAEPQAIVNMVKADLQNRLNREPSKAELEAALAAYEPYRIVTRLEAIRTETVEKLTAQLGEEPSEEQISAALNENAEYREILATPRYMEQVDLALSISTIGNTAKKEALATVAIFPGIMLVCYLILLIYFKSRGGYKAQVLAGHDAEDQKFTGGIPGPVEA